MSERVQGTSVPITGSGSAAARRSAEQKAEQLGEAGEQVISAAKDKAEKVYHAACDACHNWRHYPKVVTTILLLSMFLLGAFTMAGVSKVGIISKGSFVSSHWDRQTADAHHALDVILDHLQHPELYEHKTGFMSVQGARSKIGNFLKGLWPGAKRRVQEQDEYLSRGGRGLMEQVYDKGGDLKDDISYGARRAAEQAKDLGYGVTDKISDFTQTLKDKFMPDTDSDDYFGRAKEKVKRTVGGDRERDYGGGYEDDDFNEATSKLRRVVRKADRGERDL